MLRRGAPGARPGAAPARVWHRRVRRSGSDPAPHGRPVRAWCRRRAWTAAPDAPRPHGQEPPAADPKSPAVRRAISARARHKISGGNSSGNRPDCSPFFQATSCPFQGHHPELRRLGHHLVPGRHGRRAGKHRRPRRTGSQRSWSWRARSCPSTASPRTGRSTPASPARAARSRPRHRRGRHSVSAAYKHAGRGGRSFSVLRHGQPIGLPGGRAR
jgi:hypothetical protein